MVELPPDIDLIAPQVLKPLTLGLLEENARLSTENTALREEIARRKGVKGSRRDRRAKRRRGTKKPSVPVEERVISVEGLPGGSRFKGYEDFTVQDLRIAVGHEVREAQARRRQWLIAEGLATEEHDRIVYRANLLAVLRRREMTRVAGQLSNELGLAYVEQRPGQRLSGTFRRVVEMSAEKMAVIEKSKEFIPVPWRPSLDRHLGKPVSGIIRGDDVVWTTGRQRGGPSIL